MKFCPNEVLRVIEEKFEFPTKPLFGVVATGGKEGVNTRMMRIYDIDQSGQPILLTHTGTKKWGEFTSSSLISICSVSDDKLTQVILRGTAKLETKKNALKAATDYWERIRSDVKMLYDTAYHADQPYQQTPPLTIPQDVPPTSGVVTVQPYFWEILELVIPYTNSRRFQFHYSSSEWTKERMSLG